MKQEINKIEEIFELYNSLRDKDDEYVLNIGENKIPSDNSLFFMQKNIIYENKTHFYDKKNGKVKVFLRNKKITRFHPNHIDNKKFWTFAKTNYPLLSVCGGKSKNIDNCNERTLNMAKESGVLQYINNYFLNNGFINILEIGYGHGNLFYWLEEHFGESYNYIGIDYYKNKNLKKLNQFKLIEKSGIPDYVKNNSLDIIYSFNVLQHCSQKDRNDYFTQAYSKLKYDGIFIGGMFIETEENKNESYWGFEDVNGRKYCAFFNQFTEVDKIYEFKNFVHNIGYNIIEIRNVHNNYYSFVLRKE